MKSTLRITTGWRKRRRSPIRRSFRIRRCSSASAVLPLPNRASSTAGGGSGDQAQLPWISRFVKIPPSLAKEWYSPREADFRPEYDRDAANQAKESWDEYWSWVKTFYQGAFLSPGWTSQGTAH